MDSILWLTFQRSSVIVRLFYLFQPGPLGCIGRFWRVQLRNLSNASSAPFRHRGRVVVFVIVRGFVYRLSVDNTRLSAPILVLGASLLKETLVLCVLTRPFHETKEFHHYTNQPDLMSSVFFEGRVVLSVSEILIWVLVRVCPFELGFTSPYRMRCFTVLNPTRKMLC